MLQPAGGKGGLKKKQLFFFPEPGFKTWPPEKNNCFFSRNQVLRRGSSTLRLKFPGPPEKQLLFFFNPPLAQKKFKSIRSFIKWFLLQVFFPFFSGNQTPSYCFFYIWLFILILLYRLHLLFFYIWLFILILLYRLHKLHFAARLNKWKIRNTV